MSLCSSGLQSFDTEGILMLAPDEKLKLSPKPYLSATARFKSGDDTPRDFLERCLADLAALEPKIGAFVNLNLDGARAAADQSTARRQAALADRRHADRHQGHHRDC
jgi:Asp-tRNA(Asn)/Glu-tRNA(Gln) amidotransferase A subunit family amidase